MLGVQYTNNGNTKELQGLTSDYRITDEGQWNHVLR